MADGGEPRYEPVPSERWAAYCKYLVWLLVKRDAVPEVEAHRRVAQLPVGSSPGTVARAILEVITDRDWDADYMQDAQILEQDAHFAAMLDGYGTHFRKFGVRPWQLWIPTTGYFQRPDDEVRKLIKRGVPAEIAYEVVEQRCRVLYWQAGREDDKPLMVWGTGPESPAPLSPLCAFLN